MHYGRVSGVSMIGWLKGQKIENWRNSTKQGILLACGGVGYEVQTTQRHLVTLESQEICVLWIHEVHKDDGITLFGFQNKNERDLFRVLIGINGVGPQTALSLFETLNHGDLIQAISEGDHIALCKAEGVGKRTAERISLELRTKLSSYNFGDHPVSLIKDDPLSSIQINSEELQDLFLALRGLGYEDLEIRQALLSLSEEASKGSPQSNSDSLTQGNTESLIKSVLLRLSQEAA